MKQKQITKQDSARRARAAQRRRNRREAAVPATLGGGKPNPVSEAAEEFLARLEKQQ